MRDNWTETTLGQIAVFYNGKAYKQQELLEEGKYRVLRVGNFFSNGNWYWSDLELDKNKYCDTGDLLYAWSASFGPRIWSEEKVIYHYHIWKIEENHLKVEKKFLYFWLEDDVQRMKRDAGTGSIMMHITKGEIERRAISLPPIAEQKRIVDVVSSVDAYIDALQHQVDAARAARNAVLHELLTNGGDDWTETTVGSLLSRSIGGVWGTEPGTDQEEVMVVRSTEFTKSGVLNYATGVPRSIKSGQLASRELAEGDILLEKSGGGPEQPVGRVVYVESEIPPRFVLKMPHPHYEKKESRQNNSANWCE